MKPLKVALFVKNSPWALEREKRNMGYWSYPVPEFTWKHFPHSSWERVEKTQFMDYDLIFHEDSGWCVYSGVGPPVVYYNFDSMLSDEHLQVRRRQAEMADLVLLDMDDIKKFRFPDMKTLYLPFCVNDHLFVPQEKSIDVSFHCNSGGKNNTPRAAERSELRKRLNEICTFRGWSYASGSISPVDYAASLGRSRITVNMRRTVNNRAHRVFDAMACKAALLTDKLPVLPKDLTQEGVHYVCYERVEQMQEKIANMLTNDEWQFYAERGYKLITENHTWAIRAIQLRELLYQELGL